MKVNFFGEKKSYEILAVNAFNADRKRMSILVKDLKAEEYVLLCKGADSMMLDLCDIPKDKREEVEASLYSLACEGLRTLMVAQRVVNKSQALQWSEAWNVASSSIKGRDANLATVASEMEQGLQLLGITAIEDKLQDEVPETLAELARAGITLWMLTGDKEETAINIGRSCNLILHDSAMSYMTKISNEKAFRTMLKQAHNDVVKNRGKTVSGTSCLVLDGQSFKYYDENDKDQRSRLMRIGQACRAVIACRLTPTQKQQLVRLVKKEIGSVTLAIGDGANDVPMIQEADVGIGIIGKEGKQAANNADFAIGQFRFLRRLVLVHGRWNYIRQSKVFLYCMHKNMVITLTLFCYSFYALVSGQTLFQSWIYTGFNFDLGLPIVVYGIMDRDVNDMFAMNNPEIYSTGKSNAMLSLKAISLWTLNAAILASLICLLFFVAMPDSYNEYGIFEFGTSVFTSLILGLQMKMAFLYNQWNYITVGIMLLSLAGFYVWFFIVDSANDSFPDYYNSAKWTLKNPLDWFFASFTVPMIFWLVDLIGQSWYIFVEPANETVYRERSLDDEGRLDATLVRELLEGVWTERPKRKLIDEAHEEV